MVVNYLIEKNMIIEGLGLGLWLIINCNIRRICRTYSGGIFRGGIYLEPNFLMIVIVFVSLETIILELFLFINTVLIIL